MERPSGWRSRAHRRGTRPQYVVGVSGPGGQRAQWIRVDRGRRRATRGPQGALVRAGSCVRRHPSRAWSSRRCRDSALAGRRTATAVRLSADSGQAARTAIRRQVSVGGWPAPSGKRTLRIADHTDSGPYGERTTRIAGRTESRHGSDTSPVASPSWPPSFSCMPIRTTR
jgi:hypothetical protein